MFSAIATIEPRYLVSVGSTWLRFIAACITAITRPISQRPMIQNASRRQDLDGQFGGGGAQELLYALHVHGRYPLLSVSCFRALPRRCSSRGVLPRRRGNYGRISRAPDQVQAARHATIRRGMATRYTSMSRSSCSVGASPRFSSSAMSRTSSGKAALSQPCAVCRARRTARRTLRTCAVLGVALVGDVHQQLGQAPGAHQRLLQVAQFDVEQLALHRGRAQRRVRRCACASCSASAGACSHSSISAKSCSSAASWITGASWSSMRCTAKAIANDRTRCARRSTSSSPASASGVAAQAVFDRGLRAEGAKEGRDAHHHQRGGHGLGVGGPALRAHAGHVRQQLQGHQRVAGDGLARAGGRRRRLRWRAGFQQLGGVGQHRQRRGQEVRAPGLQVRQGAGQRGRRGAAHRPSEGMAVSAISARAARA